MYDLLKNVFGFEQFKGNQKAIIKSILSGNNTFVLMPTGGGKSLCYQLPALMSEGTTIVLSPLIALMKNQVDMIRNFGTDTGVAHVMNSSLSKAELMQVREDLVKKKTKLLYVAPESLTKRRRWSSSADLTSRSLPLMRRTASRSGVTTSVLNTAGYVRSSTR